MWRSDRYLAFVRTFECVHCGSLAEHVHHFGKRIGGGGTSCKPHDTFTVPMCSGCHRLVHELGTLPGSSSRETENLFTRRALQLVSAWLEKRKT